MASTRSELAVRIATDLANNTSGAITPAVLRGVLNDVVASAPNIMDEEGVDYETPEGAQAKADAAETAAAADATSKANAAQAAAVQRSNHTGTQLMSTISNAGNAATRNVGSTSGDVAAGDAPAAAQAAAIAAAAADATTKANAAAAASIPLTQKGANNGVATLDSGGKLPASQLPAIAVSDYLGSVANQSAMLALSGEKGDWAIRSDLSTVWVITGTDPTQLSSWTQMSYPSAPVTSVAGKTGVVSLDKTDVGLPNVDNTSDTNKPVSTAQAAAIAAKEPVQTAVSQAEAEAGTSTATRSWTVERVWQAIAAKLALGTWISGATAKATPVDGDTVPLADSAASNVLKSVTWANVKATLKTYFDTLYQAAGTYLTPSNTVTVTNKRVTPRFTTLTSSATPAYDISVTDIVNITALAVAITSMTSGRTGGTPLDGEPLEFRIKDNGTARAITWGSDFVAGPTALPTTTTISKTLRVWFEYDSVIAKYVCVGAGSDA